MTLEKTNEGLRLRVRFPAADAVFLLGEFNRWATAATPLVSAGTDVWEAMLPLEAELKKMCFFVFGRGEIFGRVFQNDCEVCQG